MFCTDVTKSWLPPAIRSKEKKRSTKPVIAQTKLRKYMSRPTWREGTEVAIEGAVGVVAVTQSVGVRCQR